MEPVLQEIANAIQSRFGIEQQVFRDQVSLIVPPEKIIEVGRVLRDEFGFNFLSDETAVDYGPQQEPRFHVLYMLRDIQRNLLLSLRVRVSGASPHVETMETVFANANWFEREIWDMFGIVFDEHSDLRRIIMPYDWEGHPLRKDFPLGYEEVQFTFNQREIMMRKPHPKE